MSRPIDEGPTRERSPSSDTFASTMRSDGPPRRRVGRIVFDEARTPTLGRFRLRRRLGEGGMGVVYAADDPQLGREVAIKVLDLRSTAPAATIGAVTRTLLREARAAARLAHPNVVEVYDVGIEGDVPFVVMELVGGGTMADWLAVARPDRAAILDVLVQAARGLAAAHRVGLLHRDFKPGNVLLGRDARGASGGIRARVADFGLAIALPGDPTREGGFDPDATAIDTIPCIAGTPAFMAPEQHRAEPLDARADQFAFCATAWFALYGRLPYSVPTPHLLAAKLAYELDPPGHDVDPRLHAVIVRGLHPDRERRWPDMDALVRAMTSAPRSIRRPVLATVGVVLALATTFELAGRSTTQPCTGDAQALGTAWDQPRRDGVARVFADERSRFLVGAGPGVVAALDEWAARWSSARSRLCAATHVEHRRSEAALDRGMACLERLRRGLDGTGRALLEDPSVRARAPAVVRGLGRPEDCEIERIDDEVDDPERRRRLADIEAELGDAEALVLAGDEERAREVGERVLVRAREIDDPRLRATAAILVGKVLDTHGRSQPAREAMSEALWAATSAGLDDLALQAVVQLVWIEGVTLGDFAAAQGWARQGEAVLARLGTPALEEIALARSLAAIAQTEWRLDEARTQYERALARLPEIDDELLAGGIEYNYGAFLLIVGRPELAIDAFERSVARSESVYGPEHPIVGNDLMNVAVARSDLGQHEPALADARRALAILTAASGRLDLRVSRAHGILGFVANAAGDHETALAAYREAYEIHRNLMGDDHEVTATYEARIGEELAAAGRFDEARRRVEHAIAIHRAIAPDGELGMSLTSAALVATAEGRGAEAVARLDEAIAIFRRIGDDREAAKLESMAAPLRPRP